VVLSEICDCINEYVSTNFVLIRSFVPVEARMAFAGEIEFLKLWCTRFQAALQSKKPNCQSSGKNAEIIFYPGSGNLYLLSIRHSAVRRSSTLFG